jgi:predicted secreted protein
MQNSISDICMKRARTVVNKRKSGCSRRVTPLRRDAIDPLIVRIVSSKTRHLTCCSSPTLQVRWQLLVEQSSKFI